MQNLRNVNQSMKQIANKKIAEAHHIICARPSTNYGRKLQPYIWPHPEGEEVLHEWASLAWFGALPRGFHLYKDQYLAGKPRQEFPDVVHDGIP